jgi:hypothetical protein
MSGVGTVNYPLFLSNYLRVIYSQNGDETFAFLKMATQGLSSPRVGKLINMAVSCMEGEERYVETGVFTGYTLASAAHGNMKTVLGIDNFDVSGEDSSVGVEMNPDSIREKLKKNMEYFCVGGQVIESDFRGVNLDGVKTGVSYIDARHDYVTVIDNLTWLEPSLAKDAVIILDDLDCPGVAEALLDWLKGHKEYELLFFSKSKGCMSRDATYDKTFTNGLAVVHYKGKE